MLPVSLTTFCPKWRRAATAAEACGELGPLEKLQVARIAARLDNLPAAAPPAKKIDRRRLSAGNSCPAESGDRVCRVCSRPSAAVSARPCRGGEEVPVWRQ